MAETQKPYVSVGMPVRNGERFLQETIDSILAQTFYDFELVISDNASTDRTEELCCDYASKDNRIRYMRNAVNLGASANYNRVFELSSGRYFRWAPADDVYAPSSLEQCVDILNTNVNVVLCYPRTTLIDERSNTIGHYNDKLDLRSSNVCERYWKALSMGKVNAIYGLIRSDVLRKTSLMGNYPAADVDLLLELSLYGPFFEIQEPLFFRRMHSGAYSSLKTVRERQEFFDPKTCGNLHWRDWKRIRQHSAFIWRAPLNYSTKLKLECLVVKGVARKMLKNALPFMNR